MRKFSLILFLFLQGCGHWSLRPEPRMPVRHMEAVYEAAWKIGYNSGLNRGREEGRTGKYKVEAGETIIVESE